MTPHPTMVGPIGRPVHTLTATANENSLAPSSKNLTKMPLHAIT